jgi:hypothetical protein
MSGFSRHFATRVIVTAILLSFASAFLPAEAATMARPGIMTGAVLQVSPEAIRDADCRDSRRDHPVVASTLTKAKCSMASRDCRSQSCIGDYLQPALRDDCSASARCISASLPAARWIDADLRQIPPPPKPGLS